MDVRESASRGQSKLIASSIVISNLCLVEERTGMRPVLLLDDLYSELDKVRCGGVLEVLRDWQGQIFLTATALPEKELKNCTSFKTFHVEQGSVREML